MNSTHKQGVPKCIFLAQYTSGTVVSQVKDDVKNTHIQEQPDCMELPLMSLYYAIGKIDLHKTIPCGIFGEYMLWRWVAR